jgi:D-alanyl-D-alanine carboxypeptidase/D-alanyl-D-alanine-endopeptidase (penicillin-binding protein 4)
MNRRMRVVMKKLLITALFNICLVGFANADLTERINAIISQSSQKKALFSIHIVKPDSGTAIYSHNANSAMVPASNMKIIITAAALKYLGADYKYKTKVGLCGQTLVVVGSGDPLLGDKATDNRYGRKNGWIFEDIATALKNSSVTAIKDIVVDSSIFDDQRIHPNWPQKELNRWYASQVSGLNYNGNCVEVTPETVRHKVKITLEPQTAYVEIINKCRPTSRPPNTVWCSRPFGTNAITVRGNCYKQSQPVLVTVERPAVFFTFLLAENLANAGIGAEGQLIERVVDENCNFRLLREYGSSLTDCLARCNKDSFGLAAEALLKTIAAATRQGGKNGTWAAGREAISQYLLDLGVDGSEFYIDDASGLSRENKLSANAITEVLLDTYKSKDWQLYKNSLAVGGVDGTIYKYFKEKKYKAKILGKTGYIDGVKSFSGICTTSDGDYIFSILVNNANDKTRKAINDIAKAIIDEPIRSE